MSGTLFIVSAPSGAGKSSLVRALLEGDHGLALSVSYTTRPPRAEEVDGVDYFFTDRTDFQARLERGEFLESAEVYGNWYGTSSVYIKMAISAGRDILLEIDWQGAAQVRKLMPQVESIFILPPSITELRRRLEGRGTDSPEIIEKRMSMAREEISHALAADYLVVNDVFEVALADLMSIARARRLRMDVQSKRQTGLMHSLLNS